MKSIGLERSLVYVTASEWQKQVYAGKSVTLTLLEL